MWERWLSQRGGVVGGRGRRGLAAHLTQVTRQTAVRHRVKSQAPPDASRDIYKHKSHCQTLIVYLEGFGDFQYDMVLFLWPKPQIYSPFESVEDIIILDWKFMKVAEINLQKIVWTFPAIFLLKWLEKSDLYFSHRSDVSKRHTISLSQVWTVILKRFVLMGTNPLNLQLKTEKPKGNCSNKKIQFRQLLVEAVSYKHFFVNNIFERIGLLLTLLNCIINCVWLGLVLLF